MKVEDIKELYCSTALELYNKTKSHYDARIGASRKINDESDLSQSRLREITAEFRRNNGKSLNIKAINSYLSEESSDEKIDIEGMETGRGYREDEFIFGDLAEEGWIYNQEADTYIFRIPSSQDGRKVLSGTTVRNMIRAYSDIDNNQSTIQQIVENFPVTRKEFRVIKNMRDWTHGSLPFTEEEKQEVKSGEKDQSELVDEAVDMFDSRMRDKIENKIWGKIQKKARNWDFFKDVIEDRLHEKIDQNLPNYEVPNIQLNESDYNFAYVISPYDFHYGVRGFHSYGSDTYYGREEAEDRLINKTQENVNELNKIGEPEKVIICVGSDFCHIDCKEGQTTAGTQLSVDGDPVDIMWEAQEILQKFIDIYRGVANKVEIFTVPGNHDRDHSYHAIQYLHGIYQDQDDVIVNKSKESRTYTKYGVTTIGFSHGRNERRSRLGPILMNEARKKWGKSETAVFFVGDQHGYKKVERDNEGVIVYQLPTLKDHESYDEEKGYTTRNEALVGFTFHKDKGMRHKIRNAVMDTVV